MIMENNENSNSSSNNLEQDSQNNEVDMMLGKNDEKIVDSEKTGVEFNPKCADATIFNFEDIPSKNPFLSLEVFRKLEKS